MDNDDQNLNKSGGGPTPEGELPKVEEPTSGNARAPEPDTTQSSDSPNLNDDSTRQTSSVKILDDDLKVKVDNSSRKKKLMFVSIALATLLAAGAAYWFFVRDTAEPEVVETNQVQTLPLGMALTLVEGKVEYSQDEGTLWQLASADTELAEGDWVRTADTLDSRAIISFDDGSVMRLNRNSQVNLDTSNTSLISSSLTKGEAYARVVSSDSRTFDLGTKRVAARALGTAFIVGTKDGVDTIEVYQSKVVETASNTELSEGKQLNFDIAAETTQVASLDIEQVKKDEFVTWNRKIDRESEEFADKLGFLEDIVAPDLNVTSPVNGAKIEIPLGTTSTSIDVSGTTETGANIKVAGSDGSSQEVTADETGTFKVTMNGRAGEVAYTIKAVDKNGNTSVINISVLFEQEKEVAAALDITVGAIAQPAVGIVVNWSYKTGFEAPDGVKVLWNRNGNLSYPVEAAYNNSGNSSIFLANHNKNQRRIRPAVTEPCSDNIFGSKYVTDGVSTTICLFGGDSYAFRVCRFDTASGACDIYSNEVRITAPGGSD